MEGQDQTNKQEELNRQTAYVIERNGGHNILYAEYLKLTADLAAESEATIFGHLQPEIKYTKKDVAFMNALKFCMAFLKSYKMKETLETMKIEFPELPRKTGYSRRSELENTWSNLLNTLDDIKKLSIEDRVEAFSEAVGLPPPKAKPRKSNQDREKKRRHRQKDFD
jgi:hypothetical protein